MSQNSKSISKLEKQIPERVAYALRSAYKSAINSGYYVVIARHGKIIKIYPDLKEQVLGKVPRAVRVGKGTRIKLQ